MSTGTVESLLTNGYQARREHRLADAKSAYAEAVKTSREANDSLMLARSLTRLGGIERDLHETESALDLYQQAVAIFRTLDDPLSLAHTVRHVGDIARELNRVNLAQDSYAEALEIYRNHSETGTLDLANTLRGYAVLQASRNETQSAISNWQEAGALYNQVWQEPNSPYTQADLAPGITESQRQIALLSKRE